MATKADPSTYGPREGIIAPLPAPERGVAAVLASSPSGEWILYGSGPNVVVRSVADPALCFTYDGHGQSVVKVAKFAPSGNYIASGDASGKIIVWAFNHPEHPVKYTFPGIGGEVEDLAWDGEGKRIAAVGGGSKKAFVFSWDAGSSLAPEVIPHSKKNLTVDFKPSRPFKAVWGGEDFNLSFYGGPPFKYERGLKEHSNFVNCVRYAPDGSKFVSVSSDKKGVVYDGASGEVAGKLDPAGMHGGSIYHCAWAPDGSKLATSGADKTVKVWDMTSPGAGGAYPCVATVTLGSTPDAMQNSVTWPSAGTIVSLSLDGTLNFISTASFAVERTLSGHSAAVCALDIDRSSGTIVTGDMNGRVVVWTPRNEARTIFDARATSGEVAGKKIGAVAVGGGGMASGAWDDKLRMGDAVTGAFSAAVPLPGQPKGIAVASGSPDVRIVVTGSAIVVAKGAAIAATVEAPWAPTCVAISEDGSVVAVGGGDKKVRIFGLSGTSLTPVATTPEAGAPVSVVAVSPDGSKIALGDSLREVRLYNAKDGSALVSGRWMNHTTRVTGIAFSPSGGLIASVSSDRRICIWDPASDLVKKTFDLAHPHPFAAVGWMSEDVLFTAGTDGVIVRRVLVL